MSVDPQALIRRFASISLTLIAAVVFFTCGGERSAMASCGDYVMIGGHTLSHDHSGPVMPTCHGPNCQRQAPLPTLPTKGLLHSVPAEVACWIESANTSGSSLSSGICEQDRRITEAHLMPPLRPPCL